MATNSKFIMKKTEDMLYKISVQLGMIIELLDKIEKDVAPTIQHQPEIPADNELPPMDAYQPTTEEIIKKIGQM